MKRILSLFLILALLCGLAACGETPDTPADSGSDSTDDTASAPEETTALPGADTLPEKSFDGEEFIIWVDASGAYWTYVGMEDTEGDVMNDAVFTRNELVQERFDVTFKWDITSDGTWRDMGMFRQSVLGGDRYDITDGAAYYSTALMLYGCFTDLARSEYIDFDDVWWFPYATDTFRIGDKVYAASGFFEFPTVQRTHVWYFNGNMAEDYKLGNLYELVQNKEWTVDKMLEFSDIVSDDVNQDGKYDENDIFGVSSGWSVLGGEANTAGYQAMIWNEAGELVVQGMTDALTEIHENIWKLQKDKGYYSFHNFGQAQKPGTAQAMFVNDQVLFFQNWLSNTGYDELRNFGNYGILPSPLYRDGQTEYGSYTTAFLGAIPSTAKSFDDSALILTALEAESYRTLRPAYFESALAHKYLNDPEAIAVLDILTSAITCEISYNWATALDTKLWACVAVEENLASWLEANESHYNTLAEEITNGVLALED